MASEAVKKPEVSVIIPAHNASLFIGETVLSVLAQDMPDLEIIVVDDASTDDTPKIVEGLAKKDNRIRYFIQERKGVSAARNKGIKESRGRYISFIDHDDLWLPQKLNEQLSVFNADNEVGLVFSRAAVINESGKVIGAVGGRSTPHKGFIFRELFCKHFIPLSTVVVKKEVFDKLDEWFDESMEMAEEIDLFLRIAYRWKVDYCDDILAKWRMHPNNDSRLRRNLIVDDYKKIIVKLKRIVPNFETDYKKEIFEKQKWMAMAEIEILMSKNNRKAAVGNFSSFLKTYGFSLDALSRFVVLFIFGFNIYESLKMNYIRFIFQS